MSKIVKLPNHEKRLDEVSDWIVKFDRGMTEDDKKHFQEWVGRDRENYNMFMSVAQLWDGMDELSRLSDLFPDESIKQRERFSERLPLVASIISAVCALGLYIGLSSPFNATVAKAYETSVGEHSTVILADGSKMVLNTDSLATVDYEDSYRLITLERGEIHIDVAHDKSRPLSVKAGQKVVQAIGTAFNIELHRNNQLELIVTDGEVRVGDRTMFETRINKRKAAASEQVNLSAELKTLRLSESSLSVAKGQKVILGVAQETPVKIEDSDIQTTLSWRQGNLIFTGQSLEEAIEEISRYTSVEFEFDNDEIKQVRIAGLFKAGDVSGLLSALHETFNISAKRTGKEKINLYRKT